MRLLDWYLLKKYLVNLLFAVIAWIVLFEVITMIEQLSRFIDYGATLRQFVLYYVYFIPSVISLTLPIAALLGVLFAVSNMATHNEVVAELSAGVSLYRILAPLFIASVVLSILSMIFNETVVPGANRARLDLERYEIRKNPRNQTRLNNNIYVQDLTNRKLAVKFFNSKTRKGTGISFLMYEGGRLSGRMDAKSMSWQDSSWHLQNVVVRRFSGEEEWVRSLRDTVIRDSRVLPKNLVDLQPKPEEMGYEELDAYIEELQALGANPRKWLVERELKISMPFAILIVTLIGAPFASRKRRGGTGLNFAISLLISFLFFIVIRIGQVFGHQGTLDPMLAAWLGNLIFLLLGLYILFTVQK